MGHLSSELRELNAFTRADILIQDQPPDVPVLTLRYGTHQCHG